MKEDTAWSAFDDGLFECWKVLFAGYIAKLNFRLRLSDAFAKTGIFIWNCIKTNDLIYLAISFLSVVGNLVFHHSYSICTMSDVNRKIKKTLMITSQASQFLQIISNKSMIRYSSVKYFVTNTHLSTIARVKYTFITIKQWYRSFISF